MTTQRKILVTSALVYANGPLHLGHLVESIQTDIWVRFQKLRGHDCLYICGSDAHGTPIMLSAKKQGITPEQLIAQFTTEHKKDSDDFLIAFDNFYTTHSDENRELLEYIYKQLLENGDIETKTIKQAYDPVENIFLPDRFVKGQCPRCGTKDQHGDNCEVCGSTYTPADLVDPISVISGVTPIEKESEHYFFCLEKYTDMLKAWTHAGHLQKQVTNKLNEWLDAGLQRWDISRDRPYFGFEIPGARGKYFYVWLDAPIGYMASFKHLCAQRSDLNFDDYWGTESDVELYHFVGKDIIYFHALFWPAMLNGAGFRTPTAVYTHGFLTINGQKMSKSRGTFIKARTYLDHLEPEYLRYYYAAKLSNGVEDIDLNLEDFMLRVNADLVGKVINIASRCAGFITKRFDGRMAASCAEPALYQQLVDKGDTIADFYENREYSKVVRTIMELADQVNQYINDKQPWALAKQEGKEQEVQEICSVGINLFRILIIYLKPILPEIAKKVETFLNCEPMVWDDRLKPLLDHAINPFKPLLKRIEQDQLVALKNAVANIKQA